ncbi:MAG: hypothetical protein LBJ12_03495 [Oscillospiraceae bacterium]|jgi:hypothetical protein|nr:hypothetical protein [Oscillospiraceae bacterium]
MKELTEFIENCESDNPEPPVEHIDHVHGRVVKRYHYPYHDATVYEDGYEERFYIGE